MTESKPARARLAPAGLMFLAVTSLGWGFNWPVTKYLLSELPPLTLVLLRVVLGVAILLPLLRMQGIGFPKGTIGWKPFVAIGLLNNVIPFSLIVIGQTFIPSGLASILNATTPLFGVLVAQVLTPDEKLTPFKAVGVVVGFTGAAVMIGPDALGGMGTGVLAQLTPTTV